MRCRACNSTLKSNEIIYYPDQDRHEDLCTVCRHAIWQDFLALGWKIEHTKIFDADLLQEDEDEINR